jgi:hypothetical protein
LLLSEWSFSGCVNVSKVYGQNFVMAHEGTHSGAVSIRRKVLDKVKWKISNEFQLSIAEDYEFNMETLFKFNKSMIIDCGLYKYSRAFSSSAPLLNDSLFLNPVFYDTEYHQIQDPDFEVYRNVPDEKRAIDLDLPGFRIFLQTKGFWDILPDEISDALDDRVFEDEFLNYIFNKKQDLKGELIKEMLGKNFIDDISSHLKKSFIEMAISFFKTFHRG